MGRGYYDTVRASLRILTEPFAPYVCWPNRIVRVWRAHHRQLSSASTKFRTTGIFGRTQEVSKRATKEFHTYLFLNFLPAPPNSWAYWRSKAEISTRPGWLATSEKLEFAKASRSSLNILTTRGVPTLLKFLGERKRKNIDSRGKASRHWHFTASLKRRCRMWFAHCL